MFEALPIAISALALAVSAITAWLTLLRRGHVKATQPAVVYFGPDGGSSAPETRPKVFLRCLLYSTGRRGNVIENMFVRVRRGESVQNFNIWVYGDRDLTRGSGLYVGPDGFSTNHHFLLPADGTAFEFLPGTYRVELYASLVRSAAPRQLASIEVPVSENESNAVRQGRSGLYFDWGPDSLRYSSHVRESPPPIEHDLLKLLRKGAI